MLQQRLPFTVLKHSGRFLNTSKIILVATALTVYGIETLGGATVHLATPTVATALTVYGIETFS